MYQVYVRYAEYGTDDGSDVVGLCIHGLNKAMPFGANLLPAKGELAAGCRLMEGTGAGAQGNARAHTR